MKTYKEMVDSASEPINISIRKQMKLKNAANDILSHYIKAIDIAGYLDEQSSSFHTVTDLIFASQDEINDIARFKTSPNGMQLSFVITTSFTAGPHGGYRVLASLELLDDNEGVIVYLHGHPEPIPILLNGGESKYNAVTDAISELVTANVVKQLAK